MDATLRNSVVEALVLSSPEPLAARKIVDVMDGLTPSQVGKTVAELNNRYMESGSAFRIRELAGGYQFYVVPEFAGFVQELFTRRRRMRLTRASLETLAIIAYRQPVTKAEIEHIRGVASDGVIHNLLRKNVIAIRGRAKTVGKPLQYGSTDEFLKFFGLASLSDLPKMSEIEELIKSREPQGQTQLAFATEDETDERPQKLNIADGTYQPRDDDGSDGIPPESAATLPASEETASVEGDDRAMDTALESDKLFPQEEQPAPVLVGGDDSEPRDGVIVDIDTTDESRE